MKATTFYILLLLLSIILGVYFFGIAIEDYSIDFLQFFAVVPFLIFMGGVHGLITHLLPENKKNKIEVYPLIMGILYVVLFFVHLFVIVPLLCSKL